MIINRFKEYEPVWIYGTVINMMYLIVIIEESLERLTNMEFIKWYNCTSYLVNASGIIIILLGFYIIVFSDKEKLWKNIIYSIIVTLLSLTFWYFIFRVFLVVN